tara:strand:+ start:6312 stop:7142 length:831 start_codon:yes stop_codon:yes gene_type:complete
MLRKKNSITKAIKGKTFSINSLEKYGLFILENGFCKEDLDLLSKFRNLYLDESKIQQKILSNTGGYELGNLAMGKCFIHLEIWNLMMRSIAIKDTLNFFNVKKIEDIMQAGGNINFPQSLPQPFHTDSPLKNKYIMIFIALEKITSNNGAQEVIFESNVNGNNHIDMLLARLKHGSSLLEMNPGDILIRYSSTWHRGTKNSSFLPRAMPVYSISLDSKKSHDKDKININQFGNKITFLGNVLSKGGKYNILYVFLARRFNRIFHIFIYLAKLFKDY